MSGLPKQTAKYLPSMEKEAAHAGEPVRVDGESVARCSREEDVMVFAIMVHGGTRFMVDVEGGE